jgi:hypothetical protein
MSPMSIVIHCVRFEVLTALIIYYIYWDSGALLTTSFVHVTCLAYSSTLKLEAKYSSETSVDFQLTILR